MDWEKVDSGLAEDLAALIDGFDCRKKPMFGCPVYFVNDNMWAGVKGGRAFLRLSEADRAAIQEECDEIGIFEPRPGLYMKEYVEIPESRFADTAFVRKWLNASYRYTVRIPPKQKPVKKN